MKKAMYKARISFFTFGALALWLTLSSCANSAKSAPERIDNFVVNAPVTYKYHIEQSFFKQYLNNNICHIYSKMFCKLNVVVIVN